MRVGGILLLLASLSSSLLAQDPRLGARLDSTTLKSVTAYIDSSRADGLPAEPLVQKALEGSSKGASGDRIVAAVRTLGATMRIARGALGSESTERELVSGAAALRAGATPDALRSLRRVRGAGSLDVPLAVLADLVGLGVGVETAYRSVLDLARTQASDEEFLRLKQRRSESERP
jgi:hypothetical protein